MTRPRNAVAVDFFNGTHHQILAVYPRSSVPTLARILCCLSPFDDGRTAGGIYNTGYELVRRFGAIAKCVSDSIAAVRTSQFLSWRNRSGKSDKRCALLTHCCGAV